MLRHVGSPVARTVQRDSHVRHAFSDRRSVYRCQRPRADDSSRCGARAHAGLLASAGGARNARACGAGVADRGRRFTGMGGGVMKRRDASRRRIAGQGMTELLVAAPLLLFFGFVTVQLVLLYQAKSTLDVAVLEAAREGAVNHGSMNAIQAGLARGLTPLYAR